MKWFLVALLVSSGSPQGAGNGPHAGGHSMHAWELGEGDPARLMCIIQVETFVQMRVKPQLAEGLEPRIRGMIEVDMVKTLLCLDEGTVKALAGNQLGRDTLDIRPLGELRKGLPQLPSLPPTPTPPRGQGMTPDDGQPAIITIPFPARTP